ncbi:MAG TPA: VOC family protein [Solirubrobacteraceae bacterium]
MVSRAFPVVYASDVERAAQFWERLGFRRHVQLPAEGELGYVGLRSDSSAAELAVTNVQWAADRYGLTMGDGPRFEMYLYVADLDRLVNELAEQDVRILREPEDMPWGERIATVADPESNPVALCQQR